MYTARKAIITSALLLVLILITGLSAGCDNKNDLPTEVTTTDNIPSDNISTDKPTTDIPEITKYKTFEMRQNDVRLKYLNHPLYTFEYPEVFNLVDLNKILDHPMVYGVSDVYFTIAQKPRLPWINLSVRIMEPGWCDYTDADSVLAEWISTAESYKDTIIRSEITVSGIQATYIETNGHRPKDVFYSTRNVSFRGIAFTHKDLIWSITLDWPYLDFEPSQAQEYFEHVLETFNILE